MSATRRMRASKRGAPRRARVTPVKGRTAPIGVSVHVGLNHVNPKRYEGWDDPLLACEFDAKDMQKLARSNGFRDTTLLMTKRATSTAVISAIERAAAKLRLGDLFFLTVSSHGGQVPDLNKDEDEDDWDETWLLYDRELIDDEIYALWGKFEAGVRIVVFSDSCHSGDIVRARRRARILANPDTAGELAGRKIKAIPAENQDETYLAHRKMYDAIQKAHRSRSRTPIGANVIQISGCQDNQSSFDGDRNGLFTEKLLKVWNKGKFKGGYRKFKLAIGRLMPDDQTPDYLMLGPPNPLFERQRPFSIGS